MTRDEAVIVLATCASYDRRTVGEADVTAWHDALDDIDGKDARQAVKDWYRDKRDWIMPADVRAGVKRIRADRIGNRTVVVELENADDIIGWLDALRAENKRIADGHAATSAELAITDEQAKANRDRLTRMLAPAFQRVTS